MNTRARLLQVGMTAALLMVGVSAHAQTISFNSRSNNFIFPGTGVLVPLNDAGATSVVFSGSGAFTVLYTAECAVDGTTGAWLDLSIRVDGVELAPTGGNHAD